jgi:hypothetical protein
MSNDLEHSLPKLKLVIDNKEYEWTEQYITGEQLIRLASISQESDLFLKISPPWQDEVILPETRVDLARPGIEHFYSRERTVFLVVNGREKPWGEREITFEQLVILAFGNIANNPNTVFTVTYKNGPEKNREGSMVKGDKVFIKNKMIFNVTATDKS